MRLTLRWLSVPLLIIFISAACTPKSRYDRMLKRELGNGVRHDSLFLGLSLGMAENAFLKHCEELKSKGIITNVDNGSALMLPLNDELKHSAFMYFYPRFSEGRICEMPVQFRFDKWSSANSELSSEKLQEAVLHWYEKIYGKGFIKVKHRERGAAWVKIEGNRRITILKQNEQLVWTFFTDMSVNNQNEDFTPEQSGNSSKKSRE